MRLTVLATFVPVGLLALAAPALLPAAPAGPAREPPELAAGIRQVKAGEFAAGLAALEDAVRQLADDPAASAMLARAYVYTGVAYVGLGDHEGAVAVFGAALDLDRGLRLAPREYGAEVVRVFEDLRTRRERSAAPARTAARRRRIAKGALVAGLAGAAVAAGAGLAGGPDRALTVAQIVFTPDHITCPDGAVSVELPIAIFITGRAGGEGLRIVAVSIGLAATIRGSPLPGSDRQAMFTPSELGHGEEATIRIDSTVPCSNASGDPPRTATWWGVAILTTSRGGFSGRTRNMLVIDFP
jgi:hypothetical protein